MEEGRRNWWISPPTTPRSGTAFLGSEKQQVVELALEHPDRSQANCLALLEMKRRQYRVGMSRRRKGFAGGEPYFQVMSAADKYPTSYHHGIELWQ